MIFLNIYEFLLIFFLLLNSIRADSNSTSLKDKKKVCIIGAGPAGLTSASYALNYKDEFDISVFESNSDIGGQWLYSNNSYVGKYMSPIHSSVYQNLITNAPLVLLLLPDYRNSPLDNGSVVHHEVYLDYLKNYTKHFQIRKYIKFNTLVTNVSSMDEYNSHTKWRIAMKDLKSNENLNTICDAVMVCNGHSTRPKIPHIRGINTFPGIIMHSHSYRRPEDFANKTVLLLGAGPSGIDIGLDLTRSAKFIYLSHNHDKQKGHFPSNLKQVPGLVKVNGSKLFLKDGTLISDADSIIFCTGYLYDASFIKDKAIYERNNKKFVSPLYRDVVNAEHPTMSFIALRNANNFFTLSFTQVRWFISFLRGKINLPSREIMLRDDYVKKNLTKPERTQWPLQRQWDNEDILINEGGLERPPEYYRTGEEIWRNNIISDWALFKRDRLIVYPNMTVQLIQMSRPP